MKTITVRTERPTNPKSVLSAAKREAEKHNFSFKGTETSGSASGNVAGFAFKGGYVLHPSYLEITVTKKPIFIPNALVESEIVKFCANLRRGKQC